MAGVCAITLAKVIGMAQISTP